MSSTWNVSLYISKHIYHGFVLEHSMEGSQTAILVIAALGGLPFGRTNEYMHLCWMHMLLFEWSVAIVAFCLDVPNCPSHLHQSLVALFDGDLTSELISKLISWERMLPTAVCMHVQPSPNRQKCSYLWIKYCWLRSWYKVNWAGFSKNVHCSNNMQDSINSILRIYGWI